MYIAKVTTKYPEFKGAGYYNFLMAHTEEELEGKIEDNAHDFEHVKTVDAIGCYSVDDVLEKYPTKEILDGELFNV